MSGIAVSKTTLELSEKQFVYPKNLNLNNFVKYEVENEVFNEINVMIRIVKIEGSTLKLLIKGFKLICL